MLTTLGVVSMGGEGQAQMVHVAGKTEYVLSKLHFGPYKNRWRK